MKTAENTCEFNIGDLVQFEYEKGVIMRYMLVQDPHRSADEAEIGPQYQNWGILVITKHSVDGFPVYWYPGTIVAVSDAWVRTYLKKIS
jgi:hypothetical protein